MPNLNYCWRRFPEHEVLLTLIPDAILISSAEGLGIAVCSRYRSYVLAQLWVASRHVPAHRPVAGLTALHLAAVGGHQTAAEALVGARADTSKKVWVGLLPRDAAGLAHKHGHSSLAQHLKRLQ